MSPTKVARAARIAAPSTSSRLAPLFTATKQDQTALVIAPQWVGDAIVSIPLIEELAASHQAVDVLATPAVAAVYACCPSVRAVITHPFAHGKLQWGLRRQVAASIRGQYQTAVICPNSMKSALIPWLAGIPVRRGMTGEMRHLLLNDRRKPPQRTDGHRPSMLSHYLMLADTPIQSSDIEPLGKHRPTLTPPVGSAKFNDRHWMVLCPGAEYGPAKQWPAEHFAELAADWLSQSPGHGVKIIGGPKDRDIGLAIESLVLSAVSEVNHVATNQKLVNLCGVTSLLQAFEEIAQAKLVVSNDSGLMHAAAAFNVPVVGIFGSTDPKHTPPLSMRAQVATLGLACSPCFQRVCPLGTTACLKELKPAQITAMIKATNLSV
jgi:heptosyltransferase-2